MGDYVYLVLTHSDDGMSATVFATRKQADRYATYLRTEENKDPWIVSKAVRGDEWLHMVIGK